MKTSQLTRRMMLPALFLGLIAIPNLSQAAPNQTQHYKGKIQRLRIIPALRTTGHSTLVRTAVRDGRGYVRMPSMTVSKHRRFASVVRSQGSSTYKMTATLVGSKVYLKLRKQQGRRLVGYGKVVVPIRRTTPPPARQATYIVSRYHPLTGKHIHTQRFNNRTAALNWYNHNKKLWWLFVYSDFGRKPIKEYRSTQAVAKKSAATYNANLLDGKRAKAMPPRIVFKTQYR